MNRRKSLLVELPREEAESIEVRAAMQGVSTDKYLGYHVLRSYRGALHPEVIEFERRDGLGHLGPQEGES